MFSNLKNALEHKKISMKAYAAVLGVTEKTVQNKLNGQTPFTLPEVWTTCFDLLPEYSWTYLFNQDSLQKPA
ncbi:DNA-binding protein [Clostridium sp. D33t1_170424_F3]|uniref:DNA-binding protein n=1 Tax=Clostridium sp. D33t1_170424_F3 TaxID=2787099 RepID=UPI0018AC775C|nr:DNA-binding protein [Clostridium sp. D33t1_170424_F3]